jgi:UDP-N-acetylmuramate--alanine ligase
MEDFARAFEAADAVFIAPIFAAREDPIDGVTSVVLAEKINTKKPNLAQALPSLDAVEAELRRLSNPHTLIITMGAGDIYKVADRLVV